MRRTRHFGQYISGRSSSSRRSASTSYTSFQSSRIFPGNFDVFSGTQRRLIRLGALAWRTGVAHSIAPRQETHRAGHRDIKESRIDKKKRRVYSNVYERDIDPEDDSRAHPGRRAWVGVRKCSKRRIQRTCAHTSSRALFPWSSRYPTIPR